MSTIVSGYAALEHRSEKPGLNLVSIPPTECYKLMEAGRANYKAVMEDFFEKMQAPGDNRASDDQCVSLKNVYRERLGAIYNVLNSDESHPDDKDSDNSPYYRHLALLHFARFLDPKFVPIGSSKDVAELREGVIREVASYAAYTGDTRAIDDFSVHAEGKVNSFDAISKEVTTTKAEISRHEEDHIDNYQAIQVVMAINRALAPKAAQQCVDAAAKAHVTLPKVASDYCNSLITKPGSRDPGPTRAVHAGNRHQHKLTRPDHDHEWRSLTKSTYVPT
ncbi:MAG: hypothetical protein IPI58_01840 [Alphaproteobacteria bacterium]|nr:MAG: hypothetical protein IPI58_01840 [Alphaproteobacteria bacterium]